MEFLWLCLWLIASPVPDDWEAVNRALRQALEQVSTAFPETLQLRPQGTGVPYRWVVEPLLYRFFEEEAGRVVAPSARVLEFRPLQVRLEKYRTGWWGNTVRRTVSVRLWLGLRDPASGGYLWQQTVSGTYQDHFPLREEVHTRVEGLSPSLQEVPNLWRDLAATLAVGGLVFLLYSGGQAK